MINNRKVIAVIPARGGSKGLPRKNLKKLSGLSLVEWPVRAAKSSQFIDRVIVSTDDAEIAAVAAAAGAEIPFVRPAELASDTAGSIAVIEHALDFLESQGCSYDYVVLLEPTSPLTEAVDLDAALERLENGRAVADSIVGVSRVGATHPVFDVIINDSGLIEPYAGGDFANVGRRQDLSELFFFEGSLYISSVSVLREKKSFYHDKTLPFIVPKWKSLEVDDLVDFICIEAILNNRDCIKANSL